MDDREKDLVTYYPIIHNSVEIFAAIIGKSRDQVECGMTPSEYIKQMLMCTQERINYLLKPGRSINVRSLYYNCKSHCFKVLPSIVLFQRFVPGNLYNMTLTIQNLSKMSRPLKLSRDPDPFFSVEYRGSNYSTMIAPGLVHIYNVRFSPSEKRDYEYHIEFTSNTEVFVVSVIAIGSRPILDIPDQIEIPATAVKILSSKTILVRNVGDAPAIFNFCSESSCFSVKPSKGILGEEETMQLTVNFLSEKSGDFEANLLLNYESGEKLCLTLRSSAINCTIRIDRRSIRMEDTYLGLSRSKVLTIHNRSDYVVKFQWMRFKDNDIDIQRKEEYKKLFQLVHRVEVVRRVNLVHYNICLPDIHELVCQRIYTDEIASLTNEDFRYNHTSFLLTPEEGEIWPQSSTDVTVIFRAMEVGEISSVAYLEVTGREDRIPLRNFLLPWNFIVAANHGHICGTLIHKERPTDFGGTISITPNARTLKPDEYKSFNLSFSSNRKGDFIERIDFVIKESLEVLSLHIKGCVICPTLHFDRHSLDFGKTALENRNFVSYIANVVRTGRTNMRVDMWNSDSDPIILPLSFCGAIPSLSIKPTEINIRFSFINFPYSRSINVENDSDLDGYFYILPQTISENMLIVYSLSSYQGFLKARQSKTIDVTIVTKNLGRQTTTLNMLTMGEQAPVTSCVIISNGQGPVVSVQPICLNFGEILVLQDKVMNFNIINDSPIPAQFKLTSPKKKSSWLVEPTFGEVRSNNSEEIKVKLFLRDTGKYTDNIIVHIINSRSFSINVIATGIGCSIVFEPQIFPIFDMGFLFSHQNLSLPVTIKNFGTRHCQIIWSNDPEVRIQKTQILSKILKILFYNRKFQIEPSTVEVPANGSNVVQCKICWDVSEILTEDWYIFEHIFGQGKRKLMGTSTFKATFTEPRIAFNKRELTFCIDICPEGEKLQQTDKLIVTNQSRLNLNVLLYIDAPFYLVNNKKKFVHKKKIVLIDGTTTTIPVKFSPNIKPDYPYSRNYSGVLWFEYEEHSTKDKIQCKGAVNFPNITLHCKDLIISGILGSTVKETLRMTNNGPIPVIYKFLWAGESIEIERGNSTNYSQLQINVENNKFNPHSYNIKKKLETLSQETENEIFNLSTSTSYELQDSDSENLLMEIRSKTLDETLEKLRNIFMPTTETFYLRCLDDPEILAHIDSNFEPPTKEPLDNILDIIPHEGVLEPFSSQYVSFIFHASEPMQLKVAALCEILQGPTEIVNVVASADIIRYSVDKQIIDFGQQLFGELCRSSFTLQNYSTIYMDYKINKKNLIFKTSNLNSTIGVLTIEPNKGSIDPLSSLKITIELQPVLLGAFEIEFELQVAHVDPLTITAKGVTSYPQIYPCISRNIFKHVKLGYRAIQLLTPDFKKQEIRIRCNDDDKPKSQVPEWDERILLSEIKQFLIIISVSRGSIIPIIIKSIITYPFVTVNTKLLDFQNVIVGECLMMNVLMKNEGFINCYWEANILTHKKHEDCPFYLNYKSNVLLSGHSDIINVYFKPRKTCRMEANLKIIVKMGLETQVVTLLGHGIEYKLRISDLDISFPPTMLFTEVLEKTFTIENTCNYPVEFFWHHLDNLFLEEERIAEALTRYYGVKEILLPPRKLGERMPLSLMEFYNSLKNDDKLLNMERKNRIRARKKSSSTSRLFVQQFSSRQSSKINLQKDFNVDRRKRKKSTGYIETLRKDPSFCKRIKDPVKELFDSHETKSIPELDSSQPAKKVCILFHGAPFTEYQETACRSAKTLQVPLLCIDNVIIEGIALGDNWVSIKLRQIIDDAYQEYLSAFKRHKDDLEIKLPAATKIDVEIAKNDHETIAKKESLKEIKSPKTTKSDLETTAAIDEYSKSDSLPQKLMILFETEFAKLPREQDLKLLDPISLYEYKIQTILLLQKMFLHYTTIGSEVNKKDQNDTFLGIEIHLLTEVLRKRLSTSVFKSGFVLQTQVSNAQTTKNKKVNGKAKNEKISNREEKFQTSKTLIHKKEIREHKELEISEKQETSKELKAITDAMNDYYSHLSAVENVIKNWDPLKKDALFTPKSKDLKTDRLIDTKDKNSDISKEIYKNGFHTWYVNATDPWNRVMYDVIVNQMRENDLAKKALRAFQIVSLSTLSNSMIIKSNSSHTSIISKRESSVKNAKRKERIFNRNKEPLIVSLNASTVDSMDINEPNINTIFEKVLKPRWILQPNEIQKFKIRYQPEEVGTHRQTYGLSILDGNEITYDINVSVVADVPRLDMNPNTIFSKIKKTKVNNIIDPTYFSDVDIFDFGSLLVYEKDKRFDLMHCLQCNGSKLDIEFEDKQLSFGHVLLYRKNFLTSCIRNRSPIEIFWQLEPNEPLDPQISITPTKGIIKTYSDKTVEFCYYANKIRMIEGSLTFKAFFYEDDTEPIFIETITLSGETYDVAVNINYANPIDLKCVKVGFPTSANFTISNQGNHEVKYAILLEKQNKLAKIAPNLSLKLNEDIEINPASGSIQPKKEVIVQVTFVPKNEITLKECPILRCHLLDMNKQTSVIAEFPLTISLIAYYTKFRIYPYNEINFSSLGICTKKTLYLNVENVGKFPLHYSIVTPIKHPFIEYMTEIRTESVIKKDHDKSTDTSTRKDKSQIKKSDDRNTQEFISMLKIGPFTVTKTEGDLQPGEIDTVAIECYPEFVGSEEEDIIILVPDSVPEDRNGKLIKLSVNSCIPSVDLQDLDTIFHENHIVNRIEDFICSKEIGTHTIFARQEKCLYFRYVSVFHTHTAYLVLYNRNVIPADVELTLLADSFTPKTMRSDTFVLIPERERIQPMSHKRFAISFNPTFIETCYAIFDIAVELPPHLKDEKFSVKLVGQACVPEVIIIEPPSTKRERTILNFGRTLVGDSNGKKFAFKNIVSNDRCIVVCLIPEETVSLEVKFTPREIGKYKSQVRLFITDNPYENLTIDLKSETYAELIVLSGLELANAKLNSINERRESNAKSRRSSKSNSTRVSTPTILPISLIYKLDYGYCFVNKIYRKNFKVVNKSVNQYLRFQWSAHPNVVFTPSIGHLRPLTCKEIVATFLSSEPTIYIDTRLECTVYAIELANLVKESSWDDRETEVRWITINSDAKDRNAKIAKKTIEPVNEPKHEIVPGTTKCIQVLLNAIIAFSKYSCSVKEINFKNTLMFQTSEHSFIFSNIGTVDVEYTWQINMDEQYPMRSIANYSRVTSKSRKNDVRFKATSLTSHKLPHQRHNPSFDRSVTSNRQQFLSTRDNLIEVKPTARHGGPSDLFSSSAGLTERSSDSWLESNDLPFGIYPEKGILPPDESVECVLLFSPMDVFDYKAYLACKMENLDPELPELIIPIVGRSLLPYCHFDIPESDYLSDDRRDMKLPGPIGYQSDDNSLPEGTRVIVLDVIGIGGSHIKKFRMINPTSDDYHFIWEDRTRHVEDEIPKFHCALPEGIAERGKQVDFTFTFFAENIGTFESFWLFHVEKYNLDCLFLFVATVREPSVCCSRVHLKMRPTVMGVNVRESINVINKEEFQIPFQIARDSLYSEGRLQYLKIMPISGILLAKSEQIFWIEYQPTLVGEFQFSVKCIIKKMKAPLTIFVTTTTYDVIVSVTYVDQNGQIVQLNQDKENIIDCGKLLLKAPVTIVFEIINSSKMTLYYSWDLGMISEIVSRNMYTIAMPQKQDHVLNESRSICSLIVTALQKTVIKNHPILLKISRGPTYQLILKATANKPILEFSFNYYNFGPCYVRNVSAASYHVDLRITNSDDISYILECKFEEKPHISVNLDALSETIVARSSIVIPIIFRPLEQVHYRDDLHFIINSTIEKKITITGEGIIYKIRLVNPRDKSVDLGNLPINKTISRKVPVINDGRAALELKFDLMKNLSGYDLFHERIHCPLIDQENSKVDRTRASITETKRSNTLDETLQTDEANLSQVLKIEPAESIVLQPGKIANVVVKYKPIRRIHPFVIKVAFQTNSTIQPLFILRGSCIGAEFRLNKTYVPFGIVVRGCLSETKIMLLNTGDIGARFKWNMLKLPEDFNIAPATGYCSPGMDVNFVISFQPTRHDSLIEGNATLEIEKYRDLGLRITGASCKLPDPIDTLFFSCRVREKIMRSLNVENDIVTWKLKPEITGEYFFVDKVSYDPSKKSATCTIAYVPLVMNCESNLHEGTLLLKLPDDKAPLVYCLRGLSLPPQVLQRITRQFPAKTKYTELLPVYNWLSRQQRFECQIENINGKDPVETVKMFTFVGNTKIDVPANGQRDYRAEFYSYKESKYNFKITFTNEENEYQFYELQYDITRPQEIESIKLITVVRSPVCHALELDNPLKKQDIIYTAKCQHPCITIHDVPKLVAPLCSEIIRIEYRPLHPAEETTVALDVNCEELGLFPYELRLRAIPASPEKTTRVDAVLGSSVTFSLNVTNHAENTAIFIIKVNNECFTTPKNIEVPALRSASFDVTYEPCDVENVSATMTATSEIAGEFVFPLIGTYSLPKPQGPYTVAANAPASISFKNIFRETKSFELIFDDPQVFVTTTSLDKIKQKQVISIVVRLKDNGKREMEDDYPVTGKLLVYCTDPKISHINWTYYLRGIRE
ncbi:Hydrocephalus-inducing protein [Trachymyrmex zeteki]|uniref:Hydrocephalus-inducing protein n=1 Tax=Mycetomoellerius zeteki TaxID=64791 RepID=A0A151WXJ4_9HYME|nr:Hydrocephalus-inducing protein [Trachymyrmex zeteki]